MNTSIAVPHEE